MKLINISSKKHPNTFAMVDDEDFEYLNQWRWHAQASPYTHYVSRTCPETGSSIQMHRVIMKACPGAKIDHRDGDGLNNQKSNLRQATVSQNGSNRRRQRNNKSGWIGVSFDATTSQWKAQISVKTKKIYLGVYEDPVQAARVRDLAARKYHGEFAALNFPMEA